MLDRHLHPRLKPLLHRCVGIIDKPAITPDGLTLVGFAIGVLALCLLSLHTVAAHVPALYAMAAIWGVVMICFALSMQAKVLRLAADATDVAMALFSGIFNVGIGGGALLGSQVSLHWGMANIGCVGGGVALLAFAWCAFSMLRWSHNFALPPGERMEKPAGH